MTTDEKLAAILAAVQTDPGNRGLAELFTACPGDFAAACRSIAAHPAPTLNVVTGFYIPSAKPPAFETDGPLGAAFLCRALEPLDVQVLTLGAAPISNAFRALNISMTSEDYRSDLEDFFGDSHFVGLERAGPARDGHYYSMRGIKCASPYACDEFESHFTTKRQRGVVTIGIGDGGNEIGMGKIPHDTIVKNIPNGDLIHCRVPTDHLIVAGVSNWGAYALAAGVYVLRGVKPPADLFDPDRERAILEVMVREGPLVDGVTGKQTATVDGLTWDEYAKPLIRIREILES